MDKLFDKFTLYDFFGYMIPGILATYILNDITGCVINKKPFFEFNSNFIESVTFFVFSYFIGTVLHEISEILESFWLKKVWKGMPSERFLNENDTYYSSEYKEQLKKYITEEFNIHRFDNISFRYMEGFNLIRNLLRREELDDKIQLFNAIYGMYRTFFAGAIACFLLYFIGSILTCIKYDRNNLYEFIVFMILFLIFSLIMKRRVRRFADHYANKVYSEFFFYSCNKNNKTSNNN